MDGLRYGEGRMMISSVVWAQCINVTDTQTATQPRRHCNSSPNMHRRHRCCPAYLMDIITFHDSDTAVSRLRSSTTRAAA